MIATKEFVDEVCRVSYGSCPSHRGFPYGQITSQARTVWRDTVISILIAAGIDVQEKEEGRPLQGTLLQSTDTLRPTVAQNTEVTKRLQYNIGLIEDQLQILMQDYLERTAEGRTIKEQVDAHKQDIIAEFLHTQQQPEVLAATQQPSRRHRRKTETSKT